MKKLIMHPVFAGPLIIVGLALLVVYALIPPPPDLWSWAYVRNELWQMRGGVGALLGAGLGLGAVAVAANLGFDHLISAQKHQAELDRQARETQMAEDRKFLAAGLRGELQSVISNCTVQAEFMRTTAKQMAEFAADTTSPSQQVPIDQAPIIESFFFKANASELGLLDADLVSTVTTVYGIIASWRRRAEKEELVFPELQAKYLPRFADNLEKQVPGIQDLIRRLEAVERGLPDPG